VRKMLSPGDCSEGRILCPRVLLFVDACAGSSTALYHLKLLFDDRSYQKYGYGNHLAGSCIYSRVLSAGRGNLLKYPVFVNSAYAV
jgi:hypothetical protein